MLQFPPQASVYQDIKTEIEMEMGVLIASCTLNLLASSSALQTLSQCLHSYFLSRNISHDMHKMMDAVFNFTF